LFIIYSQKRQEESQNELRNIVLSVISCGFVKIAMAFPYSILNVYISEMFPVEIRGTSIGLVFLIGKLSAVFAPNLE
jgi:MFS family permease